MKNNETIGTYYGQKTSLLSLKMHPEIIASASFHPKDRLKLRVREKVIIVVECECANCGHYNSIERDKCEVCGAKRKRNKK